MSDNKLTVSMNHKQTQPLPVCQTLTRIPLFNPAKVKVVVNYEEIWDSRGLDLGEYRWKIEVTENQLRPPRMFVGTLAEGSATTIGEALERAHSNEAFITVEEFIRTKKGL